MRDVVIVSAARTPIGSFGGKLKDIQAVTLGAIAAKEAMKRGKIDPGIIDEVILGNVLQAGLGQNVARQVAMAAGIPKEVPAMTINKVCGSGLRTVSLAAQIIKAGDADCILAGGTESMSQAGYIVPTARWGARMGDTKMIDIVVNDGLTCAFNNCHMGITAENIVDQWSLTREELDAFAAVSQNRAEAAIKAGKFKDEIVPVEIPQKKGDSIIFDTDEYPKAGVLAENLSKMKPVFKADGFVTAANASGINDGGAALIVMAKDKADEMGLDYLCSIKSYASVGVEPSIMGIGPIPASQKALKNAELNMEDIDLFEANEAFASQCVAVGKDLGIDPDKLNVNGGAIALGHPIGASGARILITLIYEMQKRSARYGLATLCIGGGQGTALIIENKYFSAGGEKIG